jgi:hypothetical protein
MSPRESYAQTLKLLRKQRQQLAAELAELEPIIAGLERLATREAVPAGEDEPHEVLPEHPPIGPYSQMEFIPAALHFLRSVGIPQTTQEIADALVAKGFRTRSKDFKNTAQALLKRAMDAGCPLHRTGRSTWEVRAS